MSERGTQSPGNRSEHRRIVLWQLMLIAIGLASGWALICVACAYPLNAGDWGLMDGDVDKLLIFGLAPVSLLSVLALFLWAVVGPPHTPSPKKQ